MASSSCHVTEIKHDVFISFRGKDVRRGLLSHLVKELHRAKIDAYVDDRLETGDEISSSLVKAIEGSQILLVIFSKDYASSKWCLEELVKIVECMERNKQIVIPIFYNVDPSDVRHQKGDYGAAMAIHKKIFKEDMVKIQVWRSALKKVAQISGSHYLSDFENESDLVDETVKDISNKLSKLCSSELDNLSESNGLVGNDQNIAWIKSLLTNETRKVLKLGIWGMGGIGKTTIAKIVFDTYSPKYESSCFLENVTEELENHQLCFLQEKLISELLEKEISLTSGKGKANCHTKRMLSRKKVLIVLDDVNSPTLLKCLLEPICLGEGSRVIVTSRDKQVFIAGEFHETHMVKELNFEESLKLFCINAFNESQPKMGYEELSKRAVALAKGIPLALKVSGSYFHSKSKDTWECALESFKKYPDGEIQSVLKVSYNGLRYTEKQIFLDIAFFFKEEDKDYVISRLDVWHFHGVSGIQALQDKALITISTDNRIQMHDLIQEMGWEVVREESKDPGRRSRLRDPEEVNDALKNNKGTDSMEGMLLDVSQIGEVAFNLDSLKRMPNLRLLKFYTPLLAEVPRQIRYFVPEDFVNANLKRIPANGMIEEMDWEIVSRESGRWSRSWDNEGIGDVFKTNKGAHVVDAMEIIDTIIQMHILRLTKLNLPISEDFVNVKGSGQFVMPQKLSKLPGICKSLVNYNESNGVLVLETNNVSGSKQLMPLPRVNIGSALKELTSLGCEVHIKSLYHLVIGGYSVSQDISLLPNEIRPLDSADTTMDTSNSSTGILSNLGSSGILGLEPDNVRQMELSVLPREMIQLNSADTRMELLNSYTANIMSLECSDVDRLQLETLPNELPFLRSAYYHRLSNCRQEDSGKPRLLVLFDGLRYSERLSLSILRELSFPLDGSSTWSHLRTISYYQWLLFCHSPRLINWRLKYWLVELILDMNYMDWLHGVIKDLLQLKVLYMRGCRFLRSIQGLPRSIQTLNVDDCVSLETVGFSSNTSGHELEAVDFSFNNCTRLDASKLNFPIADSYRHFFHPIVHYPASEVPEWFTYRTWGHSITIEATLPSNDIFSCLLCFVLSPSSDIFSVHVECHSYLEEGKMLGYAFEKRFPETSIWNPISDHVYMCSLDVHLLRKIKGGRVNDQSTSSTGDPKVMFLFSFEVEAYGGVPKQKLDGLIKECGVCTLGDYRHFIKTKRHRDVFDLETAGIGNGGNCGDPEPPPPTKKLRGSV